MLTYSQVESRAAFLSCFNAFELYYQVRFSQQTAIESVCFSNVILTTEAQSIKCPRKCMAPIPQKNGSPRPWCAQLSPVGHYDLRLSLFCSQHPPVLVFVECSKSTTVYGMRSLQSQLFQPGGRSDLQLMENLFRRSMWKAFGGTSALSSTSHGHAVDRVSDVKYCLILTLFKWTEK